MAEAKGLAGKREGRGLALSGGRKGAAKGCNRWTPRRQEPVMHLSLPLISDLGPTRTSSGLTEMVQGRSAHSLARGGT